LLANLMQRGEVDLHQHGDDHHPDQQADRQIDLRHFQRADGLGGLGHQQAEQGAGDDAQEHPQRQVALEKAERCARGLFCRDFTCRCHRLLPILGLPMAQ